MPMILMGDEVRRTQFGNNNNYCHDDETNWFDWSLLQKHADLHRFVKLLIDRRVLRTKEAERQRKSLDRLIREAQKAWHGVQAFKPDWGDCSHSLAFEADIKADHLKFYLMMNAFWEPLQFELPPLEGNDGDAWRRWIDTSLDSPQDIVDWRNAPLHPGRSYSTEARSVVVLFANADD
jgi:glycogen operon protein